MRIHLFEFEDLSWFPGIIREGMVDYLRFILGKIDFYQPIVPLLFEGLEKSGQNKIVDLCSGGGGAMEQVMKNLNDLTGREIRVTLTDKFPNIGAYEYLEKVTAGKIDFIDKQIDAMRVPPDLKGLRTMFSSFHHFKPTDAKKILKAAVDNNMPIAIFDGGDKNILILLGIILVTPIIFFLFAPFFKPFKISRIFFTYVLPLIPLCTIWDGVVSIIRFYEPEDLQKLIQEADPDKKYHWKTGQARHKLGLKVNYLLGYGHNSGS